MSKQQPRKKGNLQPASSTRAAALLTSTSGGGSAVPSAIGFVGFDGFGSNVGSSLTEEFGPGLDDDLRIVFRKLSKKDALTREKALKELAELLSTKDDAAIESIAFCWMRPYAKLSLDGGFKVRAGSHNVMSAFAARLGRSLGKLVKQVVPYLILGMNDHYGEVAQSAENCFHSAFRPEKRLQAVRMCSSETMTICTELVSSTGTLFNAQKYDTEETEEMRQTRLISSALLAIHRIVNDATDVELTPLRDHLAGSLWTDNKFWKTGCKHNSGAVRAAMFRMLRTWIERFANDFELYAKSAATAIVGALEDSDVSVAKNVFDCWLLCLANEEFWKNVSIDKAVIPKFLAILRGNSPSTCTIIGPCLLPSFSAICLRVESEKREDLMRRWMSSLIQGMSDKPDKVTVTLAKPKTDSWIVAFVDCFKYCISNSNGSQLFIDELLENLLTTIRLALDKKGSSTRVVSQAVAWTVSRSSVSAAVPNFAISHFVEQLTKELMERDSGDGATIDFVEGIVASGANNLGASLASQLFHNCLKSAPSVDSSATMASIAASKGLNTPAFWQQLDKLGWKSADDVVLRLLELVAVDHVDPVSVPAHISTALMFISELCTDVVAEQTLRRLSQCDDAVVRKALLVEVLKRLDLKPVAHWIASDEFKAFWLRCLQEAAVEQDADIWSTLMAYTKHFIGSTRTAEQAIVEDTLVALSNILTAWCQSMITERSADRCLTMIVQLVQVIFDSGHIASDNTSLEVIVRQIWILLLDASTHLSDQLAASLKAIVAKAVAVRKSDDLYISLIGELTNRLDSEVFSIDRMHWFTNCALHLSAHKEEKMNAFCLSTEAEKRLFASVGSQYSLMFWLDDCCPIPLTKPESCENGSHALRSFINRTVFSALLLMGCGGNCWSTVLLSESSTTIATSVIAVAALVRRLAAEDVLDSHTETLTSSLRPALEVLRTDGAGRFALVKLLMRSALASPDALLLLSLSLVSELLNADERRSVERSLAGEARDPAVDVEKVAMVSTALRVPMTSAIRSREETLLRKWTLIFQLAAATYDSETALSLLDVWLTDHQEEMQSHLLLCCDGSNVGDWSTLAFNCALMRFLRRTVEDVSTLSAGQRDFLCCSLVSWLQTCEHMVESGAATTQEFSLFSCHVLSLFDSCAQQALSGNAVADFVQEWSEFFAESCANVILPWLFSKFGGSTGWDFVCEALCSAVRCLNKQALLSVQLPTLLDPHMEENNYPARLQSLLLHAAPLLRSRHRSAQLASWSIITNVVDDLYAAETVDIGATGDEQTASSKPTDSDAAKTIPLVLKQTLDSSYRLIETHLNEGAENCDEPDLLAFLLGWDALLGFMAKVAPDQKPKYSTALTEPIDRLMLTLFTVMPERPFSRQPTEAFGDLLSAQVDGADALPDGDIFAKHPVFLHSQKRRTRGEVEHLACNIFYRALATFPALVRQWHHSQNKAFAATVNRYTMKYVSPILSAAEMESVGKSGKTFDAMTVTVRPSVREVIAKYQMEDTSMELIVTLPADYPLSQAVVNNERAVVGVEIKRRWLLQLTVYLAHQNGSLLDGLLLWKRNIDRHVEGVEDCPICMMTVHSGNYQLPKVCCRQCKKRFHGACLYKWFESSNQSSCPLCRSLF